MILLTYKHLIAHDTLSILDQDDVGILPNLTTNLERTWFYSHDNDQIFVKNFSIKLPVSLYASES